MARRKNAAALFEVIHADERFPRRHASRWSLRAPRFWFGRGRAAPSGDGPLPVETIDYATPDDTPRGPSLLARLAAMIPAMTPRVGLSLDPERQLVRFQLSYTGALVAAFAMVVAVALSYMVGRQTSHRPMPALAEQTTDELRNGPAFADVLDVGNDADAPVAMAVGPVATAARPAAPAAAAVPQQPTATAASARQTAARSNVAAAAAAQQSPQQPVRPSQWTEPKAPDTYMVTDASRLIGLQYVIIQSYPEQEKQLADAAMQTLNQHGVLCTVERGLPYAPSWYCVVGITGFARVRDVPEYDAYIARIQQISDQFAGTSKFKKFEPKPFRWREIKSAPAKSGASTPAAAAKR